MPSSTLNAATFSVLNMTTLQDRIAAALRHTPMSQAELARRAKVSRATITMWVQGPTQEMKGEPAVLAAQALRVNAQWLQLGTGPMLGGAVSAPTIGERDRRDEYSQAAIDTITMRQVDALQSAVRAMAHALGIDARDLVDVSDEARDRVRRAMLRTGSVATRTPRPGTRLHDRNADEAQVSQYHDTKK